MNGELFVPADFAVPEGLVSDQGFRLAPLGPQHNEADYAAWTGSIDHIRATPGFAGRSWPRPMSLEDNLRDLARHAQDFAERRGFTYTVLGAGSAEVIGCVYIYPHKSREPGGSGGVPGGSGSVPGASVQSWVRADRATLDRVLHDTVLAWLERDWPFHSVDHAPRA